MFCAKADVLVISPQKLSNAFRAGGLKILARQNSNLFYALQDPQSKKVEMDKNEMMIVVLRHQRSRLDELVNMLEQMEVISAEDYDYCANGAAELIRNLKSVKRFALGEAVKGVSRCAKVSS